MSYNSAASATLTGGKSNFIVASDAYVTTPDYGTVVLQGGNYDSVTVLSGGSLNASGGGGNTKLTNLTVSGAGLLYVYGATNSVTHMTVQAGAGGWYYVFGGAFASDVTLLGGKLILQNAGTVLSGAAVRNDAVLRVDGCVASGIALSGGIVSAGVSGYLDNVAVTGGVLWVDQTTASANDVTQTGGTVSVCKAGASVTDFTQRGGNASIYNSGAVTNFNLSGGTAYLTTGATLNNVTQTGGNLSAIVSNANVHVNGLTIEGTTVAYFFYENSCTDLTVRAGANPYFRYGASLSGATVSGGKLVVMDEGTIARNVTVSGGEFLVYENAVASDVAVSGGTLAIRNQAVVSNIAVQSGGTLHIQAGGSAINVSQTYGTIDVQSGGQIEIRGGEHTGLTVNDGASFGFAGRAVVSNLVVNSGGTMYKGGFKTTYRDLTVSSGAKFYIQNNAILRGDMNIARGTLACFDSEFVPAYETIFENVYAEDGTIYNFSGNIVLDIGDGVTMDNAYVYMGSGATGSNAGLIIASSGAQVRNTSVGSGGEVYVYAHASGSSIDVLNSGKAYVLGEGASATDIRVSDGGFLYAREGGLAKNFTVAAGASLTLASGAVIGGPSASPPARPSIWEPIPRPTSTRMQTVISTVSASSPARI